ncbi:hypothetical protein ScPMuIL_011685 [Solemya velum]
MCIDCFTCTSYNSSDLTCGDPFHPAFGNYVRKCRQRQDGTVGLRPARFCIKIKGTSTVDGTEMVIRSCSLENMDSVCGIFKFEAVSYNGCVLSCQFIKWTHNTTQQQNIIPHTQPHTPPHPNTHIHTHPNIPSPHTRTAIDFRAKKTTCEFGQKFTIYAIIPWSCYVEDTKVRSVRRHSLDQKIFGKHEQTHSEGQSTAVNRVLVSPRVTLKKSDTEDPVTWYHAVLSNVRPNQTSSTNSILTFYVGTLSDEASYNRLLTVTDCFLRIPEVFQKIETEYGVGTVHVYQRQPIEDLEETIEAYVARGTEHISGNYYSFDSHTPYPSLASHQFPRFERVYTTHDRRAGRRRSVPIQVVRLSGQLDRPPPQSRECFYGALKKKHVWYINMDVTAVDILIRENVDVLKNATSVPGFGRKMLKLYQMACDATVNFAPVAQKTTIYTTCSNITLLVVSPSFSDV